MHFNVNGEFNGNAFYLPYKRNHAFSGLEEQAREMHVKLKEQLVCQRWVGQNSDKMQHVLPFFALAFLAEILLQRDKFMIGKPMIYLR